MQALHLTAFGPTNDVLQFVELPRPEPEPGQVLIKVRAAGINFADIYRRRGTYPLPAPLPLVPGMEVAGVVEAVGSGVETLQPGQRVMAWLTHGGYAQYAAAPAAQTLLIPNAVTDAEATALLVQGLTAVGLLRTGTYRTVLVLAATGGVGSILVQLAKNQGKRVIAAVGSPEKLAAARALGADEAVCYAEADWVEQVRAAAGGEGVDGVFEANGGAVGTQALQTLREGGTAVVYGSASGEPTTFTGQQLIFPNQTVRGYGIYGDLPHFPEFLAELVRYREAGTLQLPVHAYAFDQIHQALQDMEDRRTQGKVVALFDAEA